MISGLGLPSDFVRKGLLLLRSGYVRELAAASYPPIQCDGGETRSWSSASPLGTVEDWGLTNR